MLIEDLLVDPASNCLKTVTTAAQQQRSVSPSNKDGGWNDAVEYCFTKGAFGTIFKCIKCEEVQTSATCSFDKLKWSLLPRLVVAKRFCGDFGSVTQDTVREVSTLRYLEQQRRRLQQEESTAGTSGTWWWPYPAFEGIKVSPMFPDEHGILSGGNVFAVMEHVEGLSLYELASGRLLFNSNINDTTMMMDAPSGGGGGGGLTPMLQKLYYSVVEQTLLVCALTHRLGIGYRDWKPENLIYDVAEDRLRLIDFGSSRKLLLRSSENNKKGLQSLLLSSQSVYYGNYRAPEIIFGEEQDDIAKSEAWAVGSLLFFLLSGGDDLFDDPNVVADTQDDADEDAATQKTHREDYDVLVDSWIHEFGILPLLSNSAALLRLPKTRFYRATRAKEIELAMAKEEMDAENQEVEEESKTQHHDHAANNDADANKKSKEKPPPLSKRLSVLHQQLRNREKARGAAAPSSVRLLADLVHVLAALLHPDPTLRLSCEGAWKRFSGGDGLFSANDAVSSVVQLRELYTKVSSTEEGGGKVMMPAMLWTVPVLASSDNQQNAGERSAVCTNTKRCARVFEALLVSLDDGATKGDAQRQQQQRHLKSAFTVPVLCQSFELFITAAVLGVIDLRKTGLDVVDVDEPTLAAHFAAYLCACMSLALKNDSDHFVDGKMDEQGRGIVFDLLTEFVGFGSAEFPSTDPAFFKNLEMHLLAALTSKSRKEGMRKKKTPHHQQGVCASEEEVGFLSLLCSRQDAVASSLLSSATDTATIMTAYLKLQVRQAKTHGRVASPKHIAEEMKKALLPQQQQATTISGVLSVEEIVKQVGSKL